MNNAIQLKHFNRNFARSKAAQLMNINQASDTSKNFGLTKAEFNRLCVRLKEGDELLFETTFMTHFEQAMNYLKKVNGALHNDAYDIVMNVLIEFRKRILDDKVKYGNLKFMFTQMCVQRYKRQKTDKWNVDDYFYVSQYETNVIDEEMFTMLEEAMNELGDRCRKIIEEIYYLRSSYKSLEQKYNIAASNLRKQKERCMTKLKMNLRQLLNRAQR